MRVIDQKRGCDGDGNAPADEEAGDADGEFLQEKRDDRAEQAEAEREEQGKPERRDAG